MQIPKLSLETHGHSNAVVFHDGNGNRTVLATETDAVEQRIYREFVEEATRLKGVDLIHALAQWIDGVCCYPRHDHWKSLLFHSLISHLTTP